MPAGGEFGALMLRGGTSHLLAAAMPTCWGPRLLKYNQVITWHLSRDRNRWHLCTQRREVLLAATGLCGSSELKKSP